MPKFLVTFGHDSAEIEAATPDDAWAGFCANHAAAMKHPNLYERTITEIVSEVLVSPEPEPESPVVEAEVCQPSAVQESEVHVEFSEPHDEAACVEHVPLEAVGFDADGTVKPIDDLSYKPSAGWEGKASEPEAEAVVQSAFASDHAEAEHV